MPALVEMLRAKSPFYQPLLAKLAFLLPAKPQDAVMRSAWLVDGAGLRLGATRALASLGPAARAAIPELTAAIHRKFQINFVMNDHSKAKLSHPSNSLHMVEHEIKYFR